MEKFDKWHEEARKEFKESNLYVNGVGEDFVVMQDGTVRLDSGEEYVDAVKPFKG